MRPAWKIRCPFCSITIVVMSEIMPSVPATQAPRIGDAVRCDSCENLALVVGTEGNSKVLVQRLHGASA